MVGCELNTMTTKLTHAKTNLNKQEMSQARDWTPRHWLRHHLAQERTLEMVCKLHHMLAKLTYAKTNLNKKEMFPARDWTTRH